MAAPAPEAGAATLKYPFLGTVAAAAAVAMVSVAPSLLLAASYSFAHSAGSVAAAAGTSHLIEPAWAQSAAAVVLVQMARDACPSLSGSAAPGAPAAAEQEAASRAAAGAWRPRAPAPASEGSAAEQARSFL